MSILSSVVSYDEDDGAQIDSPSSSPPSSLGSGQQLLPQLPHGVGKDAKPPVREEQNAEEAAEGTGWMRRREQET